MHDHFTVRHVEHTSARSFEALCAALEAATGDVSDGILANELAAAKDIADLERRMRALEGESGFMRFLTIDHGALLTLFGSPVKARFYSVGNPLLAMTMLKYDVRVALNVPVRLLVYQAPDGSARLGYDLPSSLMSQLGNAAVTAAAEKLDAKLAAFAERLAKDDL